MKFTLLLLIVSTPIFAKENKKQPEPVNTVSVVVVEYTTAQKAMEALSPQTVITVKTEAKSNEK